MVTPPWDGIKNAGILFLAVVGSITMIYLGAISLAPHVDIKQINRAAQTVTKSNATVVDALKRGTAVQKEVKDQTVTISSDLIKMQTQLNQLSGQLAQLRLTGAGLMRLRSDLDKTEAGLMRMEAADDRLRAYQMWQVQELLKQRDCK